VKFEFKKWSNLEEGDTFPFLATVVGTEDSDGELEISLVVGECSSVNYPYLSQYLYEKNMEAVCPLSKVEKLERELSLAIEAVETIKEDIIKLKDGELK
jgi:hypothetical protein